MLIETFTCVFLLANSNACKPQASVEAEKIYASALSNYQNALEISGTTNSKKRKQVSTDKIVKLAVWIYIFCKAYQIPLPSPTETCPIKEALGAMKALGATVGSLPLCATTRAEGTTANMWLIMFGLFRQFEEEK